VIDASCGKECPFLPVEEKEVSPAEAYQETLTLSPYSVNLIVLKQKPKEEVLSPPAAEIQPPLTMTVPTESGTPAHPVAPGVTADNVTENK